MIYWDGRGYDIENETDVDSIFDQLYGSILFEGLEAP